jgi:hypothetical protein
VCNWKEGDKRKGVGKKGRLGKERDLGEKRGARRGCVMNCTERIGGREWRTPKVF